jgi:hypothetical protein
MKRYLLVQTYIGSNVKRNKYEDATLISYHDTLEEAYYALDVLAEAFGEADREYAERCFVVDALRRPVERPRETVQ